MTHPNVTEHSEQMAVIRWADVMSKQHPELRWLFAVPNERFSMIQRVRFAEEGVKPGVADLCLPIARGGFFGLYIEMKRPATPGKRKGQVKPAQQEFIDFVQEQGYYAKICWGQYEATEFLDAYLKMPPTAFPGTPDELE